MIYGHRVTLFVRKSRSDVQGGGGGGGGNEMRTKEAMVQEGGRLMQKGNSRAYEGGKNDGCPAAMVVCKNVSLYRQQRRSHLNTACPWQVLSAFLLLPLLLPVSFIRTLVPSPFTLLSLTSLYIFTA